MSFSSSHPTFQKGLRGFNSKFQTSNAGSGKMAYLDGGMRRSML